MCHNTNRGTVQSRSFKNKRKQKQTVDSKIQPCSSLQRTHTPDHCNLPLSVIHQVTLPRCPTILQFVSSISIPVFLGTLITHSCYLGTLTDSSQFLCLAIPLFLTHFILSTISKDAWTVSYFNSKVHAVPNTVAEKLWCGCPQISASLSSIHWFVSGQGKCLSKFTR